MFKRRKSVNLVVEPYVFVVSAAHDMITVKYTDPCVRTLLTSCVSGFGSVLEISPGSIDLFVNKCFDTADVAAYLQAWLEESLRMRDAGALLAHSKASRERRAQCRRDSTAAFKDSIIADGGEIINESIVGGVGMIVGGQARTVDTVLVEQVRALTDWLHHQFKLDDDEWVTCEHNVSQSKPYAYATCTVTTGDESAHQVFTGVGFAKWNPNDRGVSSDDWDSNRGILLAIERALKNALVVREMSHEVA